MSKKSSEIRGKRAGKARSQTKVPPSGTWTKRDDVSGRFLREASKRFADTMKRLAKR